MSKLDLYNTNISTICDYFGVSEECASYLYHRAFRSRRRDDKYMSWDVKLQNAIVKADKCMGLDWSNLHFGEEEKQFSSLGILIDEMDEKVFRWASDDLNTTTPSSEWQTISYKKKPKKKIYNLGLIKRPGLFL